MLVIFSVLPVGYASLQDSSRQIVETEIFNMVGAELDSTARSQLTNYQATRFPIYLDNEGEEQSAASNAIFIVGVRQPGRRCESRAEQGDRFHRLSSGSRC